MPIHYPKNLRALHYYVPVISTLKVAFQSWPKPLTNLIRQTVPTMIHRGPCKMTSRHLAGPRGTTLTQLVGVSPPTDAWKPSRHLQIRRSASSWNLSQTHYAIKYASQLSLAWNQTPQWTPMRTPYEFSYCLSRVGIAPLKLNLEWKGFTQNPN
jgi:hypothetical protein